MCAVLGVCPLPLQSDLARSGVLHLGQDFRSAGTDTDLDPGELCLDDTRGEARVWDGGWGRHCGLDLCRSLLQNHSQNVRHRKLAAGHGSVSFDLCRAGDSDLAQRANRCRRSAGKCAGNWPNGPTELEPEHAVGVLLVIFTGNRRCNLYFFSCDHLDGLAIPGHRAAGLEKQRRTCDLFWKLQLLCGNNFAVVPVAVDDQVPAAFWYRDVAVRAAHYGPHGFRRPAGSWDVGRSTRFEGLRPGAPLFHRQIHHRIALSSAFCPDQVAGQMVYRYRDLAHGRRSCRASRSDFCHFPASAGPSNQLDCAGAGQRVAGGSLGCAATICRYAERKYRPTSGRRGANLHRGLGPFDRGRVSNQPFGIRPQGHPLRAESV